jgi:glyoxylase-like metal-dependent hydrolase (beta-lactamase superfamily II)
MLRITDAYVGANTYIAPTGVHNDVVVIDPGLDIDAVLGTLAARSLRPVAIACTHGHFDHIASAHELRQIYGAPVYLHAADVKVMRSANFLLMACRIDRRVTVPVVDELVGDGSVFDVGGAQLRFVHTPGHTPGSCLVELGDAIFTGDTIYADDAGLVEFPGEDPALLRASVVRLWDQLAEDKWAHPGHGPSARLSEMKARGGSLARLAQAEIEKAA